MVTPLRIDGADISHHQGGRLDLRRSKQAGLKFLYHKVTEGTTYVDDHYDGRRVEAAKAGLVFGAYHFAQPSRTDAVREARHFLKHAKVRPGDALPVLDLEVDNGLNESELYTWAVAFAKEVKRITGVLPMVYGPYFGRRKVPWLRWVPRYNNDNTPPTIPWDIWQFSNGRYGVPHSMPGLGDVDLNHFARGIKLGDIKIPLEDNNPVEKTRTGYFRVISQNVRALPLMPQGDVVEDVQLTAKQGSIIGWQEIGPERYKNAVRQLDRSVWETFWAREDRPYESPISYRKSIWEAVDGGCWLLHQAHAKVSVRRWYTWVLLRHKRSDIVILVTNKHYVAGAWNNKDKPGKEQRPAIWRDGAQLEEAWLTEFTKKHRDTPVILLGDYNANRHIMDREFPEKIGGQKLNYQVGDKAIDQVILIPAQGVKWETDDEDGELLLGRNSDHQGRRSHQRVIKRG